MQQVRVKGAEEIESAWNAYFHAHFPEAVHGQSVRTTSKIPERAIGLRLAADRLRESLVRLAGRHVEWEGLVGLVRDKLRNSTEPSIQDLPAVKVAEILISHDSCPGVN